MKKQKLTAESLQLAPKPAKRHQLSVRMDPELKKAFQVYCIQHQTTMAEQIELQLKQLLRPF